MKASEFILKAKKIANGEYGATNYGDKNHKQGGKYSIGYYDPSLVKFCFDCCGLIKAILWGWHGDKSANYGGAVYKSNGVPDIDDQGFFEVSNCQKITKVADIPAGALLWKEGHVGIYIGNKETVECTTNGKACVQFGTVNDNGERTVSGGKYAAWTHWGKIPYIEYKTQTIEEITGTTTVDDIVTEVINNKWGNGETRKENLYKYVQGFVNTAANAGIEGVHYSTITTISELVLSIIAGDFGNGNDRKNAIYRLFQDKVNAKVANKKTAREVAEEIVNGTGNWGNGETRKKNLEAAGYNYREVQDIVNELCKSTDSGSELAAAMLTIADKKFTYNQIGGCSAYLRRGLKEAGKGSFTDSEIWAIKDYHSGLDKIADRLPWGTALKKGDILWSAYHHVAVWAGDGNNSLIEAAPEDTHSLATSGTGVGLHLKHGTYNCGTGGNTWTCVYRLK